VRNARGFATGLPNRLEGARDDPIMSNLSEEEQAAQRREVDEQNRKAWEERRTHLGQATRASRRSTRRRVFGSDAIGSLFPCSVVVTIGCALGVALFWRDLSLLTDPQDLGQRLARRPGGASPP
jgi:hypothetical protein